MSVYDSENKKVLCIEHYQIEGLSYPDYLPYIQNLFDTHTFLSARFWRDVKINISHSNFALVPEKDFDEKHVPDYLKQNTAVISDKDYFLVNKLKAIEFENVFVGNKALIEWIDGFYADKELTIKHHHTTFLTAISDYNSYLSQTNKLRFYLLVNENLLSVVVYSRKGYEYSNVFYFTELNDIAYYVLFVMDIFKVQQSQTEVIAWGQYASGDEQLKVLSKYLLNFTLGQRIRDIKFPFCFDELEHHRFFELTGLKYNA